MGINNLVDVFDEKYYRHLSGGILEAFGKLFFKDLKVYLYPMKNVETGQILTSNNLHVHPRMKELYKFFKYNGKVMDIIDYDPDILHIFSRDVLKRIMTGEEGWENFFPKGSRISSKRKISSDQNSRNPWMRSKRSFKVIPESERRDPWFLL